MSDIKTDEDYVVKNLIVSHLMPLHLQWENEKDETQTSIILLDLMNKKAYGRFGKLIPQNNVLKSVFDKLSIQQSANVDVEVPEDFMNALHVYDGLVELNKEKIDGAKRFRYKDFDPRSGGQDTGESEGVDNQ